MELRRAEPPPPTFMDTLPALLFAADSATLLLDQRSRRVLEVAGVLPVVDRARGRLDELPLAGRRGAADKQETAAAGCYAASDLELFSKELYLIINAPESLDASFAVRGEVRTEWLPFVNALLYAGTVVLMTPDFGEESAGWQYFCQAFSQKLLPVLSRLWLIFSERAPELLPPAGEKDWLEKVWTLICKAVLPDGLQLSALPSHFYAAGGPAIGVLARLLRIYLPWGEDGKVHAVIFERNAFDIRLNPKFVLLIQAGLASADSAIRKQALFILKQTVKFCSSYLQPPLQLNAEDEQKISHLFLWQSKDRDRWEATWRSFFMLYESVQETQVHIIEPMIPLLKSLIDTPVGETVVLEVCWWELIVQRALCNDSSAVRRRIVEAIMDLNLEELPRLREAHSFLFGPLIESLDYTYLYSNADAPTMVSQFGMNVSRFYSTYLSSAQADATAVLTQYLHNILTKVTCTTPALFFLQALLLLPPERLADSEAVEGFKAFSRNYVLFHNIKARRLVRWQLLQIFLSLADFEVLSFAEIAAALTEFLKERSEQFVTSSKEYGDICAWLSCNFDEKYIDQNISLAVQQYFAMQGTANVYDMQCRSDEIATMLSLTLAKEGGFSESVRPLYQQMSMMGSMTTGASFVVAGVLLFTRLNDTVHKVSQGQADLMACIDVSARLYEWIARVKGVLLDQENTLTDLASARILVDGMRLFFDKASEQPESLIAYLDILLYQMVDAIDVFDKCRNSQQAESYAFQMQKVIAFKLMDAAFEMLEKIGEFHLGFVDSSTLQKVFGCELEKPPSMTDAQADDWKNLIVGFSVSKWSLISTIARFASKSEEMHELVDIAEIFKMCLLALESAKYKAVLAIFHCMQTLVCLLHVKIPSVLIKQSISLTRVILDEAANTPAWYYLYIEACIDYFFQPAVLMREDLAGGMDSVAAEFLDHIVHEVGTKRKNIVARLTKNLYLFWSSREGAQSRVALQPYIMELLLYGPLREETEERLATALSACNLQNEPMEERVSLVESLSIGSDYLVRVHMNSLLLHLDLTDRDSRLFGISVIDGLLDAEYR